MSGAPKGDTMSDRYSPEEMEQAMERRFGAYGAASARLVARTTREDLERRAALEQVGLGGSGE